MANSFDKGIGAEKAKPGIVCYQFPEAARFGRKLPKEKIYQYASLNNAIKKQFVAQINKIIWQYKLAPETINIPATKTVPEIQVFDIYLKPGFEELGEGLLKTIDKAIPFPIYYRLFKGAGDLNEQRPKALIKHCMAYKRPSDADRQQWVVEAYFESNWLVEEEWVSNLTPMPIALNLAGLYEKLMRDVIPEQGNKEESLAELVKRIAEIKNKQAELKKLQAKLEKEKQFNRKVEINHQVNQLKSEISALRP